MGRGYPMNWYEDAVGDLLKHLSLGADVVARVVEEIQRDVAPESLQTAWVKRERAAATQRLERDRDTEAWQATMRRLDAEEAAARDTRPEVIPATQVVAYLRSLPETWRRATGGRGRRMLAETLFSGIRVSGFREIEFELTQHGAALGLAEALPAGGLELRVPGYGRGERISADTFQLSIRIEPQPVMNVAMHVTGPRTSRRQPAAASGRPDRHAPVGPDRCPLDAGSRVRDRVRDRDRDR